MFAPDLPRWRPALALCAILTLAASGTVAADPAVTASAYPACDAREGAPEADRLHAEALELLTEPRRAARAAAMLERAAEERAPCDVAATEELRMAARAYHSAGRLDRARSVMLRSAERAVWTGDVLVAAHTYLDAALLALEGGDTPAAREAIQKAELLTASPLLTDTDRHSILVRIVEEDGPRHG